MYQGGGLKSDYGGHAKHFYNNLFLSADQCADVCNQFVLNGTIDTRDYFYNNTCIQSMMRQNSYISMWFCGPTPGDNACKYGPSGVLNAPCWPGVGVFYENKIFQPNKTVFAQVQCAVDDGIKGALLPMANFTAVYGGENGTTFSHDMPSSAEQVQWAWEVLGSGEGAALI